MAVTSARAWQISNAAPLHKHARTCSYVVKRGAKLCDCEVLLQHPQHLDTDNKLHGVKEL